MRSISEGRDDAVALPLLRINPGPGVIGVKKAVYVLPYNYSLVKSRAALTLKNPTQLAKKEKRNVLES